MHRALILLIGAVGAAIVVRAGMNYRSDWIALSLVGLIGVGLLVGIIEHLRRQQRVNALQQALTGLPATCDDRFTPPDRLAAWFAAARAGRAAPGLPISATPYLLGAVIMLGMLGTFLGLVQTMSGARALMHDAPDTAALRAGLSTPLSGLIRAFGTSVAGIAASVTLGLSALLVRRQERRVRERILAYIARAFSDHTPTGRQIHAMESVAEAAAALPAAAAALQAASERLDGLRAEIRSVGVDAGKAVAAAAERAGHVASTAADDATRAARDALIASTDAIQGRLDRLVHHSEEVASRLGAQTAEATANAVGAHLAALGRKLDGHAKARHASDQEHLRAIHAALERSAGAFERRQEAQLHAVSETLAEATHATRTQTVAMSEQLGHEVTALADALSKQAQAQTRALDALVTRISDTDKLRVRTLDARAADQAEAHAEAIAQAITAMREQHAEQIEALRAEGEALRAREAALAERMAAVETARGARIAAGQHALLEALRAQEDERAAAARRTVHDIASGQQALLDALRVEAEDRAASEQRTLAEISATLTRQTRATRDELAELRRGHQTLIERLAELEAERIEQLADTEARRSRALNAAMEAAEARYAAAEQSRLHSATTQAEALRDAALQGVEALHSPVQAILDRLEGASLTLAATEQKRAAELADRLDAVVGQVQAMASRVDRGEKQRAAALEQTLLRLSAALDGFDAAPVMQRMDALLQRLDAQQARASERFADAGTLVKQGAELLQSGGAELAAVAEMFASAVDGYRQASDHSLAALARVEQALARQDADAAGILREYLDQSREIFGGAMQFQEALFQELRALKGAANGG